MNTITLTPSIYSTGSSRFDVIPAHCWCGQDLEYVHGGHCHVAAQRERPPFPSWPAPADPDPGRSTER